MTTAPEGISNWGRWGKDDERGTLNYLTPEVVARAARLVKKGKVYSLAIEVYPTAPAAPNKNMPWIQGVVREDRGVRDRVVFQDFLLINTHGTTHLDPLCHVTYGRKMYNGFDISSAGERGASKCGIDKVVAVVGRGVLLDIARFKGVEVVEGGYAITPQDLESCAKAEGVAIEPGDILLLRTGYLPRFDKDRDLMRSRGAPGIGRATVPWLARKQIVAVGADTIGVEVGPPEIQGEGLYVHEMLLRDIGGYLMELMNLEQLAADKVYESLFVAAPLRIRGGMGGPMNPVAVA